jgi:hypothetical protein
LPAVEADQQIEGEVKINGNKKKYHYRRAEILLTMIL